MTKEVPVDRIVEKIVTKEVPVDRIVEKIVTKEVPVERIVEKRVEVQVKDETEIRRLMDENRYLVKEKNLHLEKLNLLQEEMDVVCSAPPQIVEKTVEVPVEKIVEKIVEVPVEKIVEKVN